LFFLKKKQVLENDQKWVISKHPPMSPKLHAKLGALHLASQSYPGMSVLANLSKVSSFS
jgi:hypothetical protein